MSVSFDDSFYFSDNEKLCCRAVPLIVYFFIRKINYQAVKKVNFVFRYSNLWYFYIRKELWIVNNGFTVQSLLNVVEYTNNNKLFCVYEQVTANNSIANVVQLNFE